MNYIVFDLEWNQPMEGVEKVNEKLPFEIVEIGAVKLNSERELVSSFNEVICPNVYHSMNHVTRKLIHMTKEEWLAGSPFTEVIARFREWCGEDVLFCTWGTLDVMELQRNMDYYELAPLADGPIRYLDVQKLWAIHEGDAKNRKALETVTEEQAIEQTVPFHRAYGDAYYTGRILERLDEQDLIWVSFDTYHYPQSQKDEVEITFPTYSKYISREFPDKQEAMKDKKVGSMRCPFCDRTLRRRIRYFSANSKHYLGVGNCEEHGLIKYKIRMKHTVGDRVYVVKTARCVTEEEYLHLQNRREKIRSMKRRRRHD